MSEAERHQESEAERIQRQLAAAQEAVRREVGPLGDVLQVRWPIATHAVANGGFVTIYSALGPSKSCAGSSLLDVAGVSQTDAAGTVAFSLNEFHCYEGNTYVDPVNVVVTPQSPTPVSLTARAEIAQGAGAPQDVTVTVWSWDLVNGNPLAGVAFYWRCLVPVFFLVT